MASSERIHLVEDDDGVARALEVRLKAAGYEVRRSSDGESALELHASDPADAIILDIRMPGIDGFEFLARLGPEGTQATPVIVASANHQDDVARRAESLGARRFLAKPYQASHLLSVLRDVLSSAA